MGYYTNLAREDYYTGGGEPPGRWCGQRADERGLQGTAHTAQVRALFEGLDPLTGEQIRAHGGKPGWDCTFSAPKSVSAVWATADVATRRAISEAQQRAVERAAAYLEQHALVTRHGHAGHEQRQAEGGMLAVSFEHSSNRNGDPQLHTHLLVANVSADGRAVDLLTAEKMTAGAVYRAELASELQRMGYSIERDGKSFRVAGVPMALTENFSSRRAEVLAALQARGLGTHDAKAASMATLATRDKKAEVDRAQSFAVWQETARQAGFNPRACLEPQPAREPLDAAEIARDALANQSTITQRQLTAAVVQASAGFGDADAALARVEEVKRETILVHTTERDAHGHERAGEPRYTTREMYELEQGMADRAERMAAQHSHPVAIAVLDEVVRDRYPTGQDERMQRVSAAQQEALRHVLGSEQIAVVEGVAGSGKSHMLGAAREAWERSGYEVRGAALAGKAAEGLQQSSGIESGTIHTLLHELDTGKTTLTERSVLVVDEAGMVGSRLMAELGARAEDAGAKLVLVGDTQQLQPIDAGGSMRAIEDRVGSAHVLESIRQNDTAEAAAMLATRAGDAAETLRYLDQKDRLHDHANRREALEEAAKASVRDRQEGKSSMVLAETNADAKAANQAAREEARALGQVKGEDAAFQTERGTRLFSEGDRVLFLKNDRELGVKNGTTAEVVSAKKNTLEVRTEAGTIVKIDSKRYAHVDHGYAVTVHKAQGATVDRAHYVPGSATSREAGYVALSRHRETVHVHIAAPVREQFGEVIGRPELDRSAEHQEARAQARVDLARQLSSSRAKGTSIDRASAAPQQAAQASREGQEWLAKQRQEARGVKPPERYERGSQAQQEARRQAREASIKAELVQLQKAAADRAATRAATAGRERGERGL